MHRSPARLRICLAAALALAGATPCAAQVVPWFNNKPQVPDKVTVFWTDTVLNQTGQRGVRGFGARIMFFNAKQDKPIRVDGALTVFAYDDTDGDLNKTVPDRKFIFTPEQVEKHYSKSKLGHSYSFWVPWDAVGGEQRIITLVCRFEPKDGGLIVSEALKQVLPGSAPLVKSERPRTYTQQTQFSHEASPTPVQAPYVHQPVQAAGFTGVPGGGAEAEQAAHRERLQTTTIQLPPNYQFRQLPQSRFEAQPQPALMHVEHAAPLELLNESPRQTAPAPATNTAAAGPDPQVVAAAAELLAKALAQQAQQAPTATPSESGSPPATHRATGEPIQRPRPDRVQMRPHPSGWPSDLKGQPQLVPGNAGRALPGYRP